MFTIENFTKKMPLLLQLMIKLLPGLDASCVNLIMCFCGDYFILKLFSLKGDVLLLSDNFQYVSKYYNLKDVYVVKLEYVIVLNLLKMLIPLHEKNEGKV